MWVNHPDKMGWNGGSEPPRTSSQGNRETSTNWVSFQEVSWEISAATEHHEQEWKFAFCSANNTREILLGRSTDWEGFYLLVRRHHHQKQRRKMTTLRLRGHLENWERAFCSRMWNPLKMTIWEIQVYRWLSFFTLCDGIGVKNKLITYHGACQENSQFQLQ